MLTWLVATVFGASLNAQAPPLPAAPRPLRTLVADSGTVPRPIAATNPYDGLCENVAVVDGLVSFKHWVEGFVAAGRRVPGSLPDRVERQFRFPLGVGRRTTMEIDRYVVSARYVDIRLTFIDDHAPLGALALSGFIYPGAMSGQLISWTCTTSLPGGGWDCGCERK